MGSFITMESLLKLVALGYLVDSMVCKKHTRNDVFGVERPYKACSCISYGRNSGRVSMHSTEDNEGTNCGTVSEVQCCSGSIYHRPLASLVLNPPARVQSSDVVTATSLFPSFISVIAGLWFISIIESICLNLTRSNPGHRRHRIPSTVNLEFRWWEEGSGQTHSDLVIGSELIGSENSIVGLVFWFVPIRVWLCGLSYLVQKIIKSIWFFGLVI
ncbi:hypothetical protein LINPERPRIM_LOCUS383 [Linum perenne]